MVCPKCNTGIIRVDPDEPGAGGGDTRTSFCDQCTSIYSVDCDADPSEPELEDTGKTLLALWQAIDPKADPSAVLAHMRKTFPTLEAFLATTRRTRN